MVEEGKPYAGYYMPVKDGWDGPHGKPYVGYYLIQDSGWGGPDLPRPAKYLKILFNSEDIAYKTGEWIRPGG